MDSSIDRWNKVYSKDSPFPEPNPSLVRYRSLLPSGGAALDLACGRGADALYLAECGFEVTAWDGAIIALERLDHEAQRRALSVNRLCSLIEPDVLRDRSFDLIYVHRYLDRAIFPALIEALNPEGYLFYETFTDEAFLNNDQNLGPKNKAYRLEAGELINLCQGLRIRLFIDGLMTNAHSVALEAGSKSLLIGQK